MIKDMMVVDNVFNDDELSFIENQAKNLKFYDNTSHPEVASWSGYRTKNLLDMGEKHKNLLHKAISTSIERSFRNNIEFMFGWNATMYLHQLTENEVFKESWLHRDDTEIYAGVVYLNKNPVENSGTLLNGKAIDNVYNRLVLYNSNQLHAPLRGFGELNTTSRLTLNIFIKEFSLTIKHKFVEI